jgi:hypothetical protein
MFWCRRRKIQLFSRNGSAPWPKAMGAEAIGPRISLLICTALVLRHWRLSMIRNTGESHAQRSAVLSLVIFFAPENKDTRLPAGTGEVQL